MNLEKCLAERYPHESDEGKVIREHITEACKKYIKLNPNDKEVEKRLCSKNENTYWQQLSEILLDDKLSKAGIQITRKTSGPDFLVEHEGKRIWIEVITPEPKEMPEEWINCNSKIIRTYNTPFDAIRLRWTGAIKDKSDKLQEYLKKGWVTHEDVYVIAVNGRLLRGLDGVWPELYGDSQHPFAVEATLFLGASGISNDRQGVSHQHRSYTPKPKGTPVPTGIFFDPNFSGVSGIWAVDVDETLLLGKNIYMVVVHNPNANAKIPRNFLPAYSEYVATDQGDQYELYWESGRIGTEV